MSADNFNLVVQMPGFAWCVVENESMSYWIQETENCGSVSLVAIRMVYERETGGNWLKRHTTRADAMAAISDAYTEYGEVIVEIDRLCS
jgi:hypothetical protein